MSQFEFIDKRVPIALDNPSIYHDISKCKNCTLCRRACADVMSVLDYYDLGVRNFLIRGFDPLNDAADYGRALLPIAREKAARRAVAERAS